MAPNVRPRTSLKAARFTESVIREMTRLSHQHKAVNLSQGFPDFPAPEAIKAAACDAINADVNQYAVTWGAKPLRDAIAADFSKRYGTPVNPETQPDRLLRVHRSHGRNHARHRRSGR